MLTRTRALIAVERYLLPAAIALFVFSWPLEKRHLVFTEYSFITGAYTEAGTMAAYASDAAFSLLLGAWLWWKLSAGRWLFLRKHGRSLSIPRAVFWSGLALVAWSFARAYPLHPSPLGWYTATRVAQGFLLMVIAADLWSAARFRVVIMWSLLVTGAFQGALGAAQTLKGSDYGIRFLGEQPLSLSEPGIAKVDIIANISYKIGVSEGTRVKAKVLRAYGTFQHPNVLAAFLVPCLCCAIFTYFSQLRSARNKKWEPSASGWRTIGLFLSKQIISLAGVVSLTAGILTSFSRSTWIVGALVILLFLVCFRRNIDRISKYVLVSSLVFGLGAPILSSKVFGAAASRIVPPETDLFLKGRAESLEDSLTLFQRKPIVGLGSGNGFLGVVSLADKVDISWFHGKTIEKQPWEYQLPHAVPLVVALDLGLVGVAFLAFLVLPVAGGLLRGFAEISVASPLLVLSAVAAILLVPLLTDHFLWSLQQGRLLFWGVVGVAAAHGARPSPWGLR